MTIRKMLADQGDFLFRWRSFVPLVLAAPGAMALADSALFEERHGELAGDLWVLIGFVVAMAGLSVRWLTVGFVPAGTSGRSTRAQRADQLNTLGLYSIVRNPLYLGNFLALLGVLISLKAWWFVLAGCLAYWLYIERIIAAEERFLEAKFGARFTDWAERTPMFVPDLRLWRRPPLDFSFKTVLRREYNGLMTVCAAFYLTELIVDVVLKRESLTAWLREDWPWSAGFAVAALTFVTLRTLKKHTTVLRVVGR